MNLYELFNSQLKKRLYIVFHERFKAEASDLHIERFVAKHFLMKPELIVVNDQIHGFKKVSKKYANLDKFPIYVELEYLQLEGEERLLEGADLYAEANITFQEKLPEITRLAKIYEKHVVLERVVPIDHEESETLVVYSRLGELLMDGFLAQDIEEGMIPIDDVETLISGYLVSFINFIKLLDSLVHHQQDTHQITRVSSTPIQD